MSNIVRHPARSAAVVGPSPPSDTLKNALEAPEIYFTTEHGMDFRPGPWKPPAEVPPALAEEAKAQLLWLSRVQLVPAEDSTIRSWLIALGNAVVSSSTLSVADVEVKVGALLALLDDYPAGCFCKATLKRAAKAFKFFPSFAELSEVLDEERAALESRRYRLTKIADARRGAAASEAAEPEWTGPRTLAPEIEAALERCRQDLAEAKPFTVDPPRRPR